MDKPTNLKIINKKGKDYVFDPIRKKYLVLTPEEEVRQLFLQYLIHEKGYPPGLIAIEKAHKYQDKKLRTDILVYDRNALPKLIVECKAPDVELDQRVLDQIARYNLHFKVDHLIITNGKQHYVCEIDRLAETYEFVKNIPEYSAL